MEKAYTDAQGEGNGAPVAYAYDALGERAVMYDSTGDTEYTYDSLGRITSVTTYRAPGEGEGSFSHEKAQGDTVAYTYDGADNLVAITYPDGTRVSYEYDLNDNLIKVTDREGLVTSYVYDAINRITEIHRPNGISTYNTYNEADQITELVNSCDDCGWVVSRYVYTYDERGFITGEKAVESLAGYAWDGRLEKHDKNSAFAYRTVETDRTFVYDDAGKLLSVTETEAGCGTCVYTYEYDLMGNRTAAVKTNTAGTVVENRKYVYNESNQLAEAVLCDGKTTRKAQYTYDADGNLTGEYSPTDRSLTTYTYTVENRLEAVYTGTAYSQTLQMAAAYDGDGNRVYQMNYNPDKDEDFSDYYYTYNSCDYKGTGIRLRVEGEVSSAERELLFLITASGAITDSSYELIEYINDVNREYAEVLVEQNINGTLDTAYVYGAAIGAGSDHLSLDHFDSTGYYLYDPRGSVTGITNEEGQIYQSYRYSVFGEITFGESQYENEYTYNGESYNPNIKSQYLRARYYCVVTADFLTEDSYLGDITKPLTLNRYNYCVGNPLNYVDPSGNMVISDWFGDLLDSLPGNNSNNSKGDYGNSNRSKNKKPPIIDDLTSIKELLGKPLPPELTQTPIPETKVEDDMQTAEENNMIEYVSGDDIYNEYYYFRNTKVSHEYITKKMLEDVGWNGPIEEQDIHLYNAVLQSFGITSGRSLRMFFATLIAEGNGAIMENRNDYTNESYTKNTRGAGYMQVTHDYTHDSFLKFVADSYYSEDEALNSYYANLANTVTYKNHEWIFWKTQSDNDTATVIGENWAMTSAAWYWTGPRLWRYYFNEDTKEEGVSNTKSKNLDLYAQGDNGHNSQYEESEGLFLIAQYFVNGWQNTVAGDKPVDDDYAYVARTGRYQILQNGNIIMNGTEYFPPNGLQNRLDAYRLICDKWGTGEELITYQ